MSSKDLKVAQGDATRIDRGSAMIDGSLPNKPDVEYGMATNYITAGANGLRKGFALSLGSITILCFILYCIFGKVPTEFGDDHVAQYYQYLSGVLIMVFVGFGFLMTFLRRYALSAVGLNFALSAMMMIIAVIAVGFAQQGFGSIEVELPLLIDSAFCAAAGMITFGAVIGFATPTQLVWLLAAEVPLYALNLYLVVQKIGTFDVGGSITIHVFGAFYGLAASFFLSRSAGPSAGSSHPKAGSNYVSDVTSMIGTIFLWIYWPSFNAALASMPKESGIEEQHQIFVVINTLLSLLGACVATFIITATLNDSIDMVAVQNATLSGGVAIGTSAALRIAPGAALGVGLIAGTLSTLGFQYSTTFVERTLGIYDTCGVQNLHGMPGVLGGLVSAILTGIYYSSNSVIMEESKGTQAGLQIAGLVTTLGIAIVSGLVVGYLCSTVRVERFAKQVWSEHGDDEDDYYEDAAVMKEVEKED